MAKNQEEIRATVPANNNWHTEDLEKKAKKRDMKKGDFVFMAVDILYNLDAGVMDEIEQYTQALHLPTWLVMQNMVIAWLAEHKALAATGQPKTLLEFQAYTDENGTPQTLTGRPLFRKLVQHNAEQSLANNDK
jgi:hypothetical protein